MSTFYIKNGFQFVSYSMSMLTRLNTGKACNPYTASTCPSVSIYFIVLITAGTLYKVQDINCKMFSLLIFDAPSALYRVAMYLSILLCAIATNLRS